MNYYHWNFYLWYLIIQTLTRDASFTFIETNIIYLLYWKKALKLIFDFTSPMKKWITILESDEPRFHRVVEEFGIGSETKGTIKESIVWATNINKFTLIVNN